MEDLDLNLYNYDLHELLTLFKLKEDFTKEEFKDAKNIVYAVHPDKSNLNKEYTDFPNNESLWQKFDWFVKIARKRITRVG